MQRRRTAAEEPDADPVVARLDELLVIEYLLAEAFRAAAERLEDFGLRGTVGDFLGIHRLHADVLARTVSERGGRPTEGRSVEALTREHGLVVDTINDDRSLVIELARLEARAARRGHATLSDVPIATDPRASTVVRTIVEEHERQRDWLQLAHERM